MVFVPQNALGTQLGGGLFEVEIVEAHGDHSDNFALNYRNYCLLENWADCISPMTNCFYFYNCQ